MLVRFGSLADIRIAKGHVRLPTVALKPPSARSSNSTFWSRQVWSSAWTVARRGAVLPCSSLWIARCGQRFPAF